MLVLGPRQKFVELALWVSGLGLDGVLGIGLEAKIMSLKIG